MRRWVFRITSALMFLLCAAALAFWVWTLRADVGCVGWADANRGEMDLAFRANEIYVVWGQPALRFVDYVPEASATAGDGSGNGYVLKRSGFVRNPGAWWVLERFLPSNGPARFFRKNYRILVHDPSEVPGELRDRESCEVIRWNWRGIEYRDGIIEYGHRYDLVFAHELSLPRRWAPLLALSAFGVLPALLTMQKLRRIRIRVVRGRANLCAACGYSLIGNTSGVCPECGTAVARTLAEAKV